MDPKEINPGKFKSLVRLIKLILRAFSTRNRTAIHATWNRAQKLQLDYLPSPTKPRHKLSLQQLIQPGAMQTLTNHIHQRLQLQSDPEKEGKSHFLPEPVENVDPAELLPKEVQQILTDSSWTRTPKDLELVCSALYSYEAFENYPPRVQKSLCKIGWYQRIEPGRIIFREGNQPSSFYLILSGSVKVMKRVSRGYEETIQNLKTGESFGETAIIKRQSRSTTCVANEVTELLVISKSDYVDLSLRQECLSYQRVKHFAFCKTVNILKYWPIAEIESQPEMCVVRYFKPNAVVVKDSRKCDWVYIIMTGACRVVKRFVDSNEFGKSGLFHHNRESRVRKIGFPGFGPRRNLAKSKTVTGLMTQMTSKSDSSNFTGEEAQEKSMKHSKTITNLQQTPETKSPTAATTSIHPSVPMRKQFLVQLQILQPKDIFGLSSILHELEPSITLVSNGADIVMIHKDFIMKHMTEPLKVKLQRLVMQYPSEEAMRKRIRDHHTWNLYKQSIHIK